jgi:CHAT domain-containing protein/tetratricopeptide (TPR) repeat protein
MNDAQENENSFYRFLLGDLSPNEQERIEIRLLEDVEFQELIQAAEFDLIDDYIRGDLTAEDVRRFERVFLNSPARRRKLATARILLNSNAEAAEATPSGQVIEPSQPSPRRRSENMLVGNASFAQLDRSQSYPLRRSKNMPHWRLASRLAAAILLLAGVGVTGWFVLLPWWQVRKGVAMLNDAYSKGRPIEARLSGFRYASWEKDRSGNERLTDYTLRDQASLTLLGVARTHPNAQTYQALGSSYLLKHEIKEAIDQFNKALTYDPSNASIHSDLGAALMELAINKQRQLDSLKEEETQAAEQLRGEILSDLSLANEHFSQAMQQGSRSAEALFNQAVCLEHLGLIDQALERWEIYLRLDPESGWAREARERVEALKKRKGQTFFDTDRIFRNFLAAYDSGDEESIWQSFMRGSQQKGNLITKLLLDQYLKLFAQGRRAEAQNKLDIVTTAGRIDAYKSGDLYTRDLAAFYRTNSPEQANLLLSARRMIEEAGEQNKKSKTKALDLYRQAKQMFVRAGSNCEVALVDLMIATIYARSAEYQSAGAIAEALAHNSKERSYLWLLLCSLSLIADLNTSQNRPAQGIEYSKLALSIAERKQDWNEMIGILGQLASAHWQLGANEVSMNYARRALNLAVIYPVDPATLWVIYRVSAAATGDFSRLFTSAAFEKQAFLLAIDMKRPLQISRSYGGLSEIYWKLKNYQEAIALAREALEIGNQYGDNPIGLNIKAHALLRLGHSYREIGNLDESLNAYADCLRISESRGLLVERLKVHRGRLLVYLAQRDYSSARTELEKTLDLFERDRHGIDDDELRVSYFETGQDIYRLGIELSVTAQQDYQEAFRYSELGRARSLLNLMQPASEPSLKGTAGAPAKQPLTLSQIRGQIPASAQIIQYSVLEQSLCIWVVSNSDFFGISQPVRAEDLGRKVDEYLECLKEPNLSDRAEILSRELYQLLIKPVETRLDPGKEVFIVADRPFNTLPFGALINPETGKYLIGKYVISFSPSSTVFIQSSDIARRKEAFSPERCVSVGESIFQQPGLMNSPLPSTIKEAEEVAALYGHNSKPLLNSGATEASVRREITTAEVVHIATHGVVNDRRPEYSGLAFWVRPEASSPDDDGMLQAVEVGRMKLPRARLVVLSACQTVIGRDYRGEGMVGLARAFIASGTPLVIASLWKVDSQMTAKMMKDFHRYRTRSNLPTTRALREAQLDMLRQDSPNYRRPYSWAGFTVVGGAARF